MGRCRTHADGPARRPFRADAGPVRPAGHLRNPGLGAAVASRRGGGVDGGCRHRAHRHRRVHSVAPRGRRRGHSHVRRRLRVHVHGARARPGARNARDRDGTRHRVRPRGRSTEPTTHRDRRKPADRGARIRRPGARTGRDHGRTRVASEPVRLARTARGDARACRVDDAGLAHPRLHQRINGRGHLHRGVLRRGDRCAPAVPRAGRRCPVGSANGRALLCPAVRQQSGAPSCGQRRPAWGAGTRPLDWRRPARRRRAARLRIPHVHDPARRRQTAEHRGRAFTRRRHGCPRSRR